MNFLKNNVCSFFFLSTKIVTATLRALWRLNREELGKICPQRKDVPFYAVKFCILVNFLSVQPLRRYEILKNNV